MKIFKILITIIITGAMLTSCGGNNIVGRWTSEEGDFEFFSDGSFTSDEGDGEYVLDGDRLKLSGGWGSELFTIDINGDTMTLYEDGEEFEDGLVLEKQ